METLSKIWEWICSEIPQQVAGNAIVAIISAGFVLFCQWIARLIRGWKVGSRNDEVNEEYDNSIIAFDIVSPYYDPKYANMILGKNKFIFEIPEQKREELSAQKTLRGGQEFAIHEPAKLDGDDHELYDFLCKYYPHRFPDAVSIDAFIKEMVSSTADYFINRLQQGKLAFNNRQIGVDYFKINRTDKEEGDGFEKQTLDIKAYETDYFTAQVMVHIYQYLCQLDRDYKKQNALYESPFDHITERKLNNEMRHFMSSLGVGGYIIYQRNENSPLEYWTVKRSSNVRNGSDNDMELRSYSFDETMDIKDRLEDIKDNSFISVYEAANRALQEELGIFSKRDERVRGHVGDFHLTGLVLIRTQDDTNARFEMQLLGYTFIHFTDKFTYRDLILKKRNAQDASFEAVEVYPNQLRVKINGTFPGEYTHTPESVYYADILRNMEDMKYIRTEYEVEVPKK